MYLSKYCNIATLFCIVCNASCLVITFTEIARIVQLAKMLPELYIILCCYQKIVYKYCNHT